MHIDELDGKVAISGVACFVKAVRLKQYYHPHLVEKVPFIVGIICGGWKSAFFSDFLAQSAGISGDYSRQEYRLKDPTSTASDYSFGSYDAVDEFQTIKLSKVGDMWGTGLFKSRACDFCSDVLTELADISLGDAWLPEYRKDGLGNSVIVTRSKLAEELIREGIQKKSLKIDFVENSKIIDSQRSSFLHRRGAISFRVESSVRSNKLVPFIRTRVYESFSISYAVVQFFRNRVREKSLEYWRLTKDLKLFNQKMKSELFLLKLVTKVYHKLR